MKLLKRWSKKNAQITSYKKEKQEFAQKIKEFQKDVQSYKERIKTEKSDLELIVKKSDKVITYLGESTVELAKSMGKILHDLVLNVDLDIKEALKKVMPEDISQIHDWIKFFERNDYLKKNKLYRKMNEKLNFLKKLEIPILQKAFNRISESLKAGDKLGMKGEFSILNATTSKVPINASTLSNQTNKSNLQNKNESLQLEYPMNILDELNNENALINAKKETVPEIIARLQDKTNNETLNQLTPGQIMDSMKKMQSFMGELMRKNEQLFPSCGEWTQKQHGEFGGQQKLRYSSLHGKAL